MRTLLKALLLLVLATQLTLPALADKGGNGNGNANGHDNGNNGNGNGGGSDNGNNGNGNSGNNGNGNSGNNGNGNGNANGQAGDVVSADAIVAVPNDQQVVQNAVKSKAALSLDAITALVDQDTDGRILDLQLLRYKGVYLYGVTVLEPDGVLHKLYYYARSGVRVRTQ
jgi:hypothetical protein